MEPVAEQIKQLLAVTTMPEAVISDLLDAAPALWLASAPPSVLACDLVLCHPALAEHEVRAVTRDGDNGVIRLTVVSMDRIGFLADTAAVLAADGISIRSASVVTFRNGLALHALTVDAPHLETGHWEGLGTKLRAIANGTHFDVAFTPSGAAGVTCSPPTGGNRLLSVTAEDQVGLLWAICRWLSDSGFGIESAHIDEEDGRANDHFLLAGDGDIRGLEAYLSAPPTGRPGPRARPFPLRRRWAREGRGGSPDRSSSGTARSS